MAFHETLTAGFDTFRYSGNEFDPVKLPTDWHVFTIDMCVDGDRMGFAAKTIDGARDAYRAARRAVRSSGHTISMDILNRLTGEYIFAGAVS